MICSICDNMACFCPDRYGDYEHHVFHSKNYWEVWGVHVMNKNESKLCRRLMSETGLGEEELRGHKKYRIMLSKAQKAGSIELDYYAKHNRTKKRLMKQATKRTGLAIGHPETQKIYKEIVKSTNRWWHYFK